MPFINPGSITARKRLASAPSASSARFAHICSLDTRLIVRPAAEQLQHIDWRVLAKANRRAIYGDDADATDKADGNHVLPFPR